jgi:hypothetical protein
VIVPAAVTGRIIDVLPPKQRHDAHAPRDQNAGGGADGDNARDHWCWSETSRSTSPAQAAT